MSEEKYIGNEIRKIDNVLQRNIIKLFLEMKLDDLSHINGWIIAYLYNQQGRDVFQRDIEESLLIRRSSVSSAIQLMEKKGLIKRESVEYDARLKKLILTEKSLKIYKIMSEKMSKYNKQLKKGISDEEMNVFFNVLNKITENAE